MRTKKHYLLPVAAGFMVLYLLIMAAATCLVHNKYMRTFWLQYDYKRNTLEYSLLQVNDYIDKSIYESEKEQQYRRIELVMSLMSTLYSDPYQKFSAAYYEYETKRLYKSQESFSIIISVEETSAGDEYKFIPLADYLSIEEIKKVAALVNHNIRFLGNPPREGFDSHEVYTAVNKDVKSLIYGFCDVRTVWQEGINSTITHPFRGGFPSWSSMDDEGKVIFYTPTELMVTDIWTNPEYSTRNEDLTEYIPVSFYFPYINRSYEDWLEWHNSTYLQEAVNDLDVEKMIELWDASFTNGAWQNEFATQYSNIKKVYSTDDLLFLASECYPWRAAFDYLKIVYIAGLALMLICMLAVLYILNRTDRQRAVMEENRRNFANALAHEMKTPLGIIRGFAENLQEDTMSEKREYYLEQVEKQTEELHHLVTEMMDMSTLDADNLELRQDDLSVGDVIREQLVKLEPLIKGRHLTIQLEETEEFHVTGDEKYLSKAIYNLLDNAVSYSDMEGTIHIIIDSKQCSIENPCLPIDPEKLEHLFEAFYQGNTNRGTQGSHRGLGLYLTRKIFALSHLTIEIKNTEQGVKVTYSRVK